MTEKCAVSWCKLDAEWTWTRTPAELRDMYRGKKWQDQRDSWERVRHVCTAHMPRWRADVYVPFGEVRKVEAAPAPKRSARKMAPPAPSPALEALMAELAETRAALERERQQVALYRQSWSAHREALEQLREARAELAALRAPAPVEAGDMLAELVA